MTPAVTANALIRFARVERSISTRIRYAPEKQTDAARHMLNGINEWAIDFHFDWRRFWPRNRRRPHHHHCSGCGGLGSFFVQGDESLVKNVGDVEVIIRLARCDLIEICAASRNIECAFDSKRLEIFCERNSRGIELELWQMQIDILRLELCAFCQNVRCDLRFHCTQTIYLVGKKNEKLEIIAGIGNADCGEPLALGVTKSCGFPHRRKIDRRT